jgi:superfamily I DNA/RNA helicase
MGDAAQLAGLPRKQGDDTTACRRRGDCSRSSDPKCSVCANYVAILRACNAVDYDDQVLLACELLEADPLLLGKTQERARHLLVDEYQDINAAQYRLIRLLAGANPRGLFVVGDDDQSIYSWRGGSPRFIRTFRDTFAPDAAVWVLSKSWRCHRHVLEGAMGVVGRYDGDRLPKTIEQYDCEEGPSIDVHNVPSDQREAEIVAAIIGNALPSRSVLVLVPTRNHGRLVAQQLRRSRLQFAAWGERGGDGLPLVARLAAWLRDQGDSVALRECLQAIVDAGVGGVPGPHSRRADKLAAREEALAAVSGLWRPAISDGVSLWDSLCAAARPAEVLAELRDGLTSLESVDEKDVPAFAARVTALLRPWANRDRFLDEVSEWVRGSTGQRDGLPQVRLMTLQGATGLQADVVCVLGLEEGTVPRGDDPDELREQARLFYVSMTRARYELHLFYARTRSAAVSFQTPYKRESGPKVLQPSRFLSAIPPEHRRSKPHPPVKRRARLSTGRSGRTPARAPRGRRPRAPG